MQNDTVKIIGVYQLDGVYQLEKDDIKDFDELLNPEKTKRKDRILGTIEFPRTKAQSAQSA